MTHRPDPTPVAGIKLVSHRQVTAHFFIRARTVYALTRGRAHMMVNPGHKHRTLLFVSMMLAVVLMGGAYVFGLIKPAGTIKNSKVVADRKTSTLYAVVGGRLYPALNLVSAQLIAGEHDQPVFVSPDAIAKMPKGPLVGIIGAAPEVPTIATPQVSQWSVCDTQTTRQGEAPKVTGVDGEINPGPPLAAGDALLMSSGGADFLVMDGYRVPIDPADAAARPEGVSEKSTVAPMSRALLDAIPVRSDMPNKVRLVDSGSMPDTCVTWRWDAAERKATYAVRACRGLPLTLEQRAHLVPTVGDDDTGVRADRVIINPGASTFVATAAVPSDPDLGHTTLWLIASNGTRFGIPSGDTQSQHALGVDRSTPRPVPSAMIQVWPKGPELSRDQARTEHSPTDVGALTEKPDVKP